MRAHKQQGWGSQGMEPRRRKGEGVLETLRGAVHERMDDHRRQLPADVKKAIESVRLLEAMDAQRRHPHEESSIEVPQKATSSSGTPRHHSLLEAMSGYHQLSLSHVLADRETGAAAYWQRRISALDEENAALSLFLIRNANHVQDTADKKRSNLSSSDDAACGGCSAWRTNVQRIISEAVSQALHHRGTSRQPEYEQPPLAATNRVSKMAALSSEIRKIREENSNLLLECAILEEEIQRSERDSDAGEHCGISWRLADAISHSVTKVAVSPDVNYAHRGWYEALLQWSAWDEEAQGQMQGSRLLMDDVNGVLDGLRDQTSLVLRHLGEDTLH